MCPPEPMNNVPEICSETSLSALEWGAAACVTEAVRIWIPWRRV